MTKISEVIKVDSIVFPHTIYRSPQAVFDFTHQPYITKPRHLEHTIKLLVIASCVASIVL